MEMLRPLLVTGRTREMLREVRTVVCNWQSEGQRVSWKQRSLKMKSWSEERLELGRFVMEEHIASTPQ